MGELDAADAEGERFAAVEREIGGAGEFEAAAQFGKMVAGQLDAHGLADGDLPEGGDVGVEIRARVGEMQLGRGAVGEAEVLLGFHVFGRRALAERRLRPPSTEAYSAVPLRQNQNHEGLRSSAIFRRVSVRRKEAAGLARIVHTQLDQTRFHRGHGAQPTEHRADKLFGSVTAV